MHAATLFALLGLLAQCAHAFDIQNATIVLTFIDKEAGVEARLLQDAWTQLGADVYNAVDRGSDPSEAFVAGATAVVLTQTQKTVSCEYCLLTSYWAVKHGVPLIPVSIQGANYSFSATKKLLTNLDKSVAVNSTGTFRKHGINLTEAAWRLGMTVPFVISLNFDATGHRGTSGVDGQEDFILQALTSARPSVPGLPDVATFVEWRNAVARNDTGPTSLPWQPDPRHFQVYLSHHISESGKDARLLKTLLVEQQRFATDGVFLDVDDLTDLRQEATNVNQSASFVIMGTPEYLSRPYCLLETYTGLDPRRNVPAVLVDVGGKGFDRTAAVEFLEALPTALEAANPGATQILLENGVTAAQVQARLLPRFKDNLDMITFDAGANLTALTRQVAQIACALRQM